MYQHDTAEVFSVSKIEEAQFAKYSDKVEVIGVT